MNCCLKAGWGGGGWGCRVSSFSFPAFTAEGGAHKIIKRKNGKQKVVIDNLATFLSISPNQTKVFLLCFAWSQLDISAISDSVSAVSEGYQLIYCWILKFAKWA
jgi:hypothetical protein